MPGKQTFKKEVILLPALQQFYSPFPDVNCSPSQMIIHLQCRLQALLTNRFVFIFYFMYNLGVGDEVVKVVILIFGVISEGLVGS